MKDKVLHIGWRRLVAIRHHASLSFRLFQNTCLLKFNIVTLNPLNVFILFGSEPRTLGCLEMMGYATGHLLHCSHMPDSPFSSSSIQTRSLISFGNHLSI